MENREKIAALDEAWRLVGYGERPEAFDNAQWRVTGSSIGIVTALVVAGMVFAAITALIGRPRALRRFVRRPTMIFGVSTSLAFAVIVNLTEHGENMRFRYEVEPLQLVLVAALAVAAMPRRSTRVARRAPVPTRSIDLHLPKRYAERTPATDA